MTPEEIYVSPDNEVLVTNFKPEFIVTNQGYRFIIHEDNKLAEAQYHLEIGRWYKVGEKSIAPNANDFIYVIHDNGVHVGHLPKNFMTISEWRERQLNEIL